MVVQRNSRVYRVHSPAAVPWNSAPQNSDLSIDIYTPSIHIHTYIHIHRAYRCSLSLLRATVIIDANSLTEPGGGGLRETIREAKRVDADIGRVFPGSGISDPVTRDELGWRWVEKGEVDWKVEEEGDWRAAEGFFEFLEGDFFPLPCSMCNSITERNFLWIIISIDQRQDSSSRKGILGPK